MERVTSDELIDVVDRGVEDSKELQVWLLLAAQTILGQRDEIAKLREDLEATEQAWGAQMGHAEAKARRAQQEYEAELESKDEKIREWRDREWREVEERRRMGLIGRR